MSSTRNMRGAPIRITENLTLTELVGSSHFRRQINFYSFACLLVISAQR